MSADRTQTTPKFDIIRLEDRLNPSALPAAEAFLSFTPHSVLDASTSAGTATAPAVSLASPAASTPAVTVAPAAASSQYQLTLAQSSEPAPTADASNGRVAMFTLVPPPPPGQLSGFVYVDEGAGGGTRDDGIKQSGEPGIQGATVRLVRSVSGTPVSTLTTTTNADGFYQFTSLSTLGTYTLLETQPAGFLDGKDAVGSLSGTPGNDTTSNITVTASANGTNYNFGELLPPVPPALGSLSGFVYVDEGANGGTRDDGIKQGGEAVISGATVTLFRVVNGTPTSVGQTVTDGNGFYQFGSLPAGTYEVRETQPAGFTDGKDTFGSTGGVAPQNDTLVTIPLAAGQNSVDNNFGELLPPVPPAPGAINGYVYVDANDDGTRQGSEAVIPGTTVTLFRVVNGTPTSVGQTTTDGSGFYQFTGLTPGGGYRVVESQPASYRDGKDTPGTVGGGNAATNDTIDAIAVPVGGTSADNNFGERLGQLSGFVYVDEGAGGGTRDDGIKQAGEPGIQGATVTLFRVQGGVATSAAQTVTNADGFYQFGNLLAGTYEVRETQPAAFTDGKEAPDASNGATTPTNDVIATIGIGNTFDFDSQSNNFGELLPPVPPALGSLSGFVYVDEGANGGTRDDGIRQSGEAVIPGTTVTLFRVVNGTPTSVGQTTTDGTGFYQFTSLPAGTYEVRETQPAGFVDGKDTFGSTGGVAPQNDTLVTIPLAAGQNSVDNNFGELLPPVPPALGSLSGFVYVDEGANGGTRDDGIRQSGEAVIPGTTVTLFRVVNGTPTSVGQTTTNGSGFYQFTGLTAGGGYLVRETQPAAFDDGKDTAGSTTGSNAVNDELSGVTVPAGGESQNNNFGELIRPTPPGALSGFVYVDANDDGIKQGTEAAIPGTIVFLRAPNASGGTDIVATATTDASGFYRFANLTPGQYWVQEVQPSAFDDGKDTLGSTSGVIQANDILSAVPVPAGGESFNNNFGELVKPGSLSGFVYVDADDDGEKDPGEAAIPGTVVFLRKPNASGGTDIVATATTDASGFYRFANLTPGQYWVQEVQPSAFDDGKDTLGSTGGVIQTNDFLSAVNVPAGVDSSANNFGEKGIVPVPPVPPVPGALSGFVYVDSDNDGVKDPGEAPIAGTTVLLRAPNATGGTDVVGTATTDGDGHYRFANLTPGQYWVQEVQPSAFDDGKDTLGSTGGVIQTNDFLSAVNVPAGVESSANNFGELTPSGALSGFVYEDTNDNGVRDSGEAAIPGTVVFLRKPNATGGTDVVGTATTDGNGFYRFANLAPGQYWVQEAQPATYIDGKDTLGSTGGAIQANDILSAVNVVSRGESVNNNFGELKCVTLFGFVWFDADKDGVFDSGENGLGGATVTISGATFSGRSLTTDLTMGQPLSVTSDANGRYSFTCLPPGNYTVTQTNTPTGYTDFRQQNASGLAPASSTPTSFATFGLTADNGALNFGKVLETTVVPPPPVSPQVPLSPVVSKQNFLGSSGN